MNLLMSYADVDDEDDNVDCPIGNVGFPVKQEIVTAPSSSLNPQLSERKTATTSTTTTSTRKRKLNISLLPLEIQQALNNERNLDSDDEVDIVELTNKPITLTEKSYQEDVSMNKNNNKNNNNNNNSLLSMLPKPKGTTEGNHSSIIIPSSSSLKSTLPSDPDSTVISTEAQKTVEKNNANVVSLPSLTPSLSAQQPPTVVVSNKGVGKLKSWKDQVKVPASSTGCSIFNFDHEKPKISFVDHLPSTLPNEYDNGAESITSTKSGANYGSVEVISSNSNSGSDDVSTHQKRRIERNIELALMNGDLEALHHVNHVASVESSNKWNSAKYIELQQREMEVNKAYNLGGSAVNQPSKQQNRKHQINSLAFQAAKVELALMETKGQRVKTKHETQSKYGW